MSSRRIHANTTSASAGFTLDDTVRDVSGNGDEERPTADPVVPPGNNADNAGGDDSANNAGNAINTNNAGGN
jgi:hypothetical protein